METFSSAAHAIILWLTGRCILLHALHFHTPQQRGHLQTIRRLCQRTQLHYNTYTFHNFQNTGIVYARVPISRHHHRFFYIGCTHNTMQTRESNRNRKFRQVSKDAIVDAELSLRWWRQHQNYYQFVPLVLQYNVPHDLLEAQEQTFIQHFQPKLNHPHIAPHMKRAFRGISQPARNKIQRRSGITSIWAKIRRRYLPPALRPLYSSHTFKRQAQVWQTICNLASNTRRRFDSTKELLKHKTPPAQLYAYHRIACNLPPTHPRPATKAINTAMRKRALPIPKNRRPAILPYLAHPSQTSTTRTFLRAQITTHRQHTLPLHPPTTTVVYARHPRAQDYIHNWRQFHRQWNPQQPPLCRCQHLHQTHPSHIHHGHIAVPLTTLVPQHHFLHYSGRSTFFPPTKQLRRDLLTAIQRWNKTHHLPAPTDKHTAVTSFIEEQLQLHEQHMNNRLNLQVISNAKQSIPDGIVHNEDHLPNKLMWYCPLLYHTTISNTFLDKEVFHSLDLPPLHHHLNTYNRILRLLPQYRWSLREWGKIPTAYILPKRKKSFAKGRPIVSFVGAMLRSLTSDLADVIYLMLRQACPDALGRGDTLHQLKSLRQAFQHHRHNPSEEQFSLHIYNQDLSGFFTSISTDRFLASLRLMTYWYRNKNPNHATTFTCTHHEPDPTMRVHRGRSRFRTPRRHTIHLNHLPNICQAVLLLNYCMVGNTLLQQTRGAPMGSPASPALCDMVVAVCEQSWNHTYRNITYNVKHCQSKQFTLSGFFATRYVDNRLTLLPTCATHLPHFTQFLSPHFYGNPIFLETEPGLDYLGFTINPTQRSIHYKATANLTDILSPHSASPDIVLRSSFRARAILARRLATPHQAVTQAMEQLSEVYTTAGYEQSWIRELSKESMWFCTDPSLFMIAVAHVTYSILQLFCSFSGYHALPRRQDSSSTQSHAATTGRSPPRTHRTSPSSFSLTTSDSLRD